MPKCTASDFMTDDWTTYGVVSGPNGLAHERMSEFREADSFDTQEEAEEF